jgi:hypothetical protein
VGYQLGIAERAIDALRGLLAQNFSHPILVTLCVDSPRTRTRCVHSPCGESSHQ